MSDSSLQTSRRQFFLQTGAGLGGIALGNLLAGDAVAERLTTGSSVHHPPRVKNVIFLNMAGGPSQLDLFDHKPELVARHGQPVPKELVDGEKFAFLRGELELLGSPFQFHRHGESGAEISELLPHTAQMADELTIIRSATTEAFNHDPAQVFLNTGSSLPGRPSMGAWVSYGLGSECADLPTFVVLNSGTGQPLGAHAWGNGFLPSEHQGVPFRSQGDAVLFLSDPAWMSRAARRRSLDALRELNTIEQQATGDPEIAARIASYEMAFRMQASVPGLMDLGQETGDTLASYGVERGKTTFANNCLLARRLIEQGVRFVQLFHRGWDHHGTVVGGGIDAHLPKICRQIDRPIAALIGDLKQRGLLDETLVVWGGEFGRTPIRERTVQTRYLGRDHHPRAFTIWMAGGGLRSGMTYGETDPLGYHVTTGKMPVHDLQATILHLLGIDHQRLTYRHQGRDFRLTDVGGQVVREILA